MAVYNTRPSPEECLDCSLGRSLHPQLNSWLGQSYICFGEMEFGVGDGLVCEREGGYEEWEEGGRSGQVRFMEGNKNIKR